MTDAEIAEGLAEMADLDRMERAEALEIARLERGDIFEKVEGIITAKAHLGRNVEAIIAELGTHWSVNEAKAIVHYLNARPVNEAQFDIEWGILAASKRIA